MQDSIVEAPKVRFINTENGEEVVAQYNPQDLDESIDVNYAKLPVLGMSHQVMQYQYTDNYKTNISLFWHSMHGDLRPANGKQPDGPYNIVASHREARNTLMSWCYPKIDAANILGGAPPRLLFVWPGQISFTCVITALKFKTVRWDVLGNPVQWSADVAIEEIRDTRLSQSEVRQFGTIRGSSTQE